MPLADEINPDDSLWSWLAFEVRRWRTEAEYSRARLGRLIGVPRQTVNNVESGLRPPTEEQCTEMDKLYNSGGFFKRLLMFARLAHERDWFRQYTQYGARALVLKVYEGQWVPGLLQTPDYARACLRTGLPEDLEAEVKRRLDRQSILNRRTPPILHVLLDQAVPQRWVGGREVMKEQLAHLLEMSERPHITLRVVPWSEGEHPGMDGAFAWIKVPEGDLAFCEAAKGGRLIREPAEVLDLAVRYDRIGAVALTVDASRRLIKEVMETC